MSEGEARKLVQLALEKAIVVQAGEVTDEAVERYVKWSVPDPPPALEVSGEYPVRRMFRDDLAAKGRLYERQCHEIAIEEAFLSFASAYDVDFYERIHPSKTVSAISKERAAVAPRYGIPASFGQVLKQEEIPSVRDLIDKKLIELRQVCGIRKRSEAMEFREWLWGQPDPFTAAEVIRAYREVITANPVDYSNHAWTRLARITSVSLAGSAAGAAIGVALAGPPGIALGAGASEDPDAEEQFFPPPVTRWLPKWQHKVPTEIRLLLHNTKKEGSSKQSSPSGQDNSPGNEILHSCAGPICKSMRAPTTRVRRHLN